jgi:hypothetical protein
MNFANQQRFSEAGTLLAEVLEVQRRVLGEDHPQTLDTVYNLGCLAALKGDRTAALHWLRQAVSQGYHAADWMTRDADLEVLRGDPEFEAIVAQAGRNAAATTVIFRLGACRSRRSRSDGDPAAVARAVRCTVPSECDPAPLLPGWVDRRHGVPDEAANDPHSGRRPGLCAAGSGEPG